MTLKTNSFRFQLFQEDICTCENRLIWYIGKAYLEQSYKNAVSCCYYSTMLYTGDSNRPLRVS